VAGTHDWLGEQAILAGKNKDVEERNNIIQSVTRGRGPLVIEIKYLTQLLNAVLIKGYFPAQ
jgi:hypothetical protein